jgi:MFS family permease
MFANFAILKYNRDLRFLFFGQFISFFGTMITSVALPYQIYELTHSTLMVGLLSLCILLPLLITALLGGVIADRFERKFILIYAEVILAFGILVLAINAALPSPHLVILFLMGTCLSAINGLHRPALESLSQQMVKPEDFAAVGSLTMMKYSISMIIGPAVGGLLIAHLGLTATFLADFMTFSVSIFSLLQIKKFPRPSFQAGETIWESLKSGFQYAFTRQELVGSYVVDFVAMVFGMPNALFPAIAHNLGGVKVLGMLYSAAAVGSLVFSLFSGWLQKVKRYGVAIAISAILWGIAIIGFGLSQNLWFALFYLALAGGFDAVSGIFRSMLWNESIPTEFRGRLAGIEMISYMSGPRLGDTESGLVAAIFGISATVISGGVLCVVSVMVCAALLPKFWQYKSPN